MPSSLCYYSALHMTLGQQKLHYPVKQQQSLKSLQRYTGATAVKHY